MNTSTLLGRATATLLVLLLVCAPLHAQKRRRAATKRARPAASANTNAPAQQPKSAARPAPSPSRTGASPARAGAPSRQKPAAKPGARAPVTTADLTFDTLLAADSYAFYFEQRNVGQMLQPGGIGDLLRPLSELSGVVNDMKQTFDFFQAHAEALADARMFAASMPGDPSLPTFLTAVELSSVEAAQKFTPEFEKYMASLAPLIFPPGGKKPEETGAPEEAARQQVAHRTKAKGAPVPSFHVRQTGNLVILSDKPLKLKSLRRDPDNLLSSQPNFRAARARFASEPVFIYVDFGVVQRGVQKAMEEATREAEQQAQSAEQSDEGKTTATATLTTTSPEAAAVVEPVEEQGKSDEEKAAEASGATEEAAAELTDEEKAALEAEEMGAKEPDAAGEPESPTADILSVVMPFVFGYERNETRWPRAMSVAIAPEGETLAVRALLFNQDGAKTSLIPFLPSLLSGPPLTPEAASLAPAETGVLVSVSLDLQKMYERMLGGMKKFEEEARAGLGEPPAPGVERASPDAAAAVAVLGAPEENLGGPLASLAAIEKLFNFKLKEDLIDSLGNEVSVSIPASWLTGSARASANPPPSPPASPTPTATPRPVQKEMVIFVSLRDKEKLQRIMPRVLLALGIRRPNEPGQGLKQGGTEIMKFERASFAFVGNYLALSPDEESLRFVVDAQAAGQTLSSSPDFTGSTRWAPRQSLGQVYVSSALVKRLFADARTAAEQETDPELKALLPQLLSEPGALTHAVVNEGDGPLHEVRVPRNIVAMFAAKEKIDTKQAPMRSNEQRASLALQEVYMLQSVYKEKRGKGQLATLEQLTEAQLMSREMLDNEGYRIELSINGDKFEATATPTDYPRKGRRSFFIDETGTLRGGDKGGQRATASDDPVQ